MTEQPPETPWSILRNEIPGDVEYLVLKGSHCRAWTYTPTDATVILNALVAHDKLGGAGMAQLANERAGQD